MANKILCWRRCFLLAATLAAFGATPLAAQDDALLRVPDVWKQAPGDRPITKQGYGWFRCGFAAPENWRNALELFAEPVDDAREYYFNGQLIGAAGEFPPTYRSGLGDADRFTIPAELVRPGAVNTVAIRIHQRDGRENFNVAAPVVFAAEEAIRLEGPWQHRAGDEAEWGKSLVDDQSPALFAARIDRAQAERELKRLQGDAGPLSPEESLKAITTFADLELDLVLSEPVIGQPLFLNFDARGRLWLLEYLQYPDPAGLKMVSRDKFLRTVYDKVPPPPPNHFRGADRITIHTDGDGDGKYDQQKTFVDGLSMATSFAQTNDGVWVLNPPYLLFYPDKNRDDVPDGDPEVHLEGFGLEDSHSIANNLQLGPDGWLYACQGSTVTGDIKRPGIDKAPVHSLGQLIWRYHPTKRIYEIFAEGGGNTFGLEIDSKGRVFSGHNGGDTRGFHYVQGGYYQKGFGKHGELSNPFAFGYFAAMAHPSVPRFTHAFVIYEGAALPQQYHGDLFGAAPLQSHLVCSNVERDRSSFKTHDVGLAMSSSDPWHRPVNVASGPDGAIYICDFYEQRIDHASHYQGRVDKGSGRVYRLQSKGAAPAAPVDLGSLSTAELIEKLGDANKWQRRTALRLLSGRKTSSLAMELASALSEAEGQKALELLWALHSAGGLSEAETLSALEHQDPFVRLWVARLACDEREVTGAVAAKLAELAKNESDVEVRSQLACSARRLGVEQCLPIVQSLLARGEDAGDIHIPLLLWWAIEEHVAAHPKAVLELFREAAFWDQPIVRDEIVSRLMRRFAQAGSQKDLLACAQLLNMAPSPDAASKLMAGFEAAFQGRRLVGLPEELVAAIAKAGGGSLALRLRAGEAAALVESLKTIADESADAAARASLIEILGELHPSQAQEALLKIAGSSPNQDVQIAALNALAGYSDSSIGDGVVALVPKLPPACREAALALLSTRSNWSLVLLQAISSGRLDRAAVSESIARGMLLHSSPQIESLVRDLWGELQGATTEEMRADVERFAQTVAAGSGNPRAGRALFMESCGKCHLLFGQGGRIGPDLTAYKRDDVQGLLLNVVNPSAQIREGFETYVLATADGRALTGFIADQDNRVVVIKSAEGQTTVSERDEIEELRAIPRSLMPEGLLKTLSDQQLRDLFAYLRSTQPLPD
jgi:putative heme-binding domain-containing protein